MSQNAFERYATFIQEYIYRKKWSVLREVQIEACEAILDTDKHVIIASGTASGKTEAAFFPILTLLEKKPSNSIGVMYLGPLKALINDQFQRLDELLGEQDIPVWPWHGDVSQAVKRKALKTAQGILQITPESLEAMLMRHPGDVCKLFSDLRFVVIDEIHALMGEDRGLQVQCLLSRLEKITGCKPRRIGLSATLNDYQPAMNYLSAGTDAETIAVGIQNHKRTLSLCVESFIVPEDEEKRDIALKQYNDFIYNNCCSKKCLIFTNSRANAEEIIANMKSIARSRNEKDVFYVHHGSISAALRQEAEHALRDNTGPTVAAATLTLELGIDIGDLDSTIQLGAPYTSASFVQRLGRSGRRTGKSQMMFLNLNKVKNPNSLASMPWDLLRAIAIIQLYLEERWVEPFEQKRKPFSLLAHQTLSALMTHGELAPGELARAVLLLPPFKNTISPDEYKALLRYMLQEEYIQRMDDGSFIVGLKGEKITKHFSFYSVFQDEEVFHVKSQYEEIGTLTSCPAVNEIFALAGRAWIVVSTDEERKVIYVKQTHCNKIQSWIGGGGDIHSKVVQRIKKVLQETVVYPYLQPTAIRLLEHTRQYAAESGLLESNIIPGQNNNFYIVPWIGTRTVSTLAQLLTHGLRQPLEISSATDCRYYLSVTSGLDINDFVDKIKSIPIATDNPDMILRQEQTPKIDKFDFMVPETLLRLAYLFNQTDIYSAIDAIANIKNR